MFYIALCDDNPIDIKEIMDCLGELKKENYRMEIIPYLSSPELIKEYEKGTRFNLIVLDMYMEPLNGIEAARILRKIDATVPIIIVTATLEFAIEGYSVNAYRYLLKPLDSKIFLKEVRHILEERNKIDSYYFSISNESGITKVKLDDILFFESDLKTIHLHTLTDKLSFRGTIAGLESKLSPLNFVRVHKSYIVNLKHVKNIFKGVITMENEHQVFVSKHRSKEVLELLMKYIAASYGT